MVLTDAQWTLLKPLVEACRPHAKVPLFDLRRTVEAMYASGEGRGGLRDASGCHRLMVASPIPRQEFVDPLGGMIG